jgi:CheY-like chemotaxis protein
MFPLDGIELAKRLRAISPMPIILLTSLGTTLQVARETGADIAAVQTKPIHRAALLETLSTVLALRTPAPVVAPRAAPAMPKLRLLLAEDNLANRKVAQLLLRKIGYDTVDIAVDGIEALEALKARDYDVVLMDVQMPNLDGLDATRRIRTEIPPERQPQIVAMTANAMVEDRETCIAAGMNDYLAKPIVPEHLRQALVAAGERRGIDAERSAPKKRVSERREAEQRARRIADAVLAGGGEMGALMRRIDWSETPLGPPYTWPQSLRTALSILLSQKHPIFLWWGRELVQFYNDAYRPILGATKHPRAMGQRGRECWTEIWDVVGPMTEAVLYRGESIIVERGLLCMDRNGFLEEGYFTYGYSPIRDESGGIGGIFVACSENTAEVIGARRNELLLDLAERLQEATDRASLWRVVERELGRAAHDLPFVLVHTRGDDGAWRLECAIGLARGSDAAPETATAAPWGDGDRRVPHLVENVPGLPVLAPWPEPPTQAYVHPLRAGSIVLGLSPRLRFDEAYRVFCERFVLALDRALRLL